MATTRFMLQSKSDTAPIYLRLTVNRNLQIKRKTGFVINYKDWSSSTNLPKQNNPINKNLTSDLRGLSNFIIDKLNVSNSEGDVIDGNWLTNIIDNYFNRGDKTDLNKLLEYGEYFIENLKYKITQQGNKGVSISTEKKYRTIVNKLIRFEAQRKKTILIKDVDLQFRSELIDFFSKEDKLGDNTIGRYLKFVKSICLDAQKNGIKTNPQLSHFMGFTVKSPKVTLSFDELEIINEAKVESEPLQIARDWLIIGCYTGQRVSDLLRMNKKFIQKIRNYEFIVLEQVKTRKIVQIPIHPKVREVLNKRKGEFPPIYTSNIDSSKAMFNKYLKKLCEVAKINTIVEGNSFNPETKRTVRGQFEKHLLVSSHICRRSFATNFYGNPKFPTPLLMNITAHSTEKMFLEYIGKKPIDYSLQLAEIWASEKE